MDAALPQDVLEARRACAPWAVWCRADRAEIVGLGVAYPRGIVVCTFPFDALRVHLCAVICNAKVGSCLAGEPVDLGYIRLYDLPRTVCSGHC